MSTGSVTPISSNQHWRDVLAAWHNTQPDVRDAFLKLAGVALLHFPSHDEYLDHIVTTLIGRLPTDQIQILQAEFDKVSSVVSDSPPLPSRSPIESAEQTPALSQPHSQISPTTKPLALAIFALIAGLALASYFPSSSPPSEPPFQPNGAVYTDVPLPPELGPDIVNLQRIAHMYAFKNRDDQYLITLPKHDHSTLLYKCTTRNYVSPDNFTSAGKSTEQPPPSLKPTYINAFGMDCLEALLPRSDETWGEWTTAYPWKDQASFQSGWQDITSHAWKDLPPAGFKFKTTPVPRPEK